jgi:hypothetical protein
MDCRPRASCYLRCMRILSVLTFLTVTLMGCQTGDRRLPRRVDGQATVFFPEVKLREGEYIEAFKVRIKGGWIPAIERIPHDWDIALEWEDGSCVVVRGQARHFSSGMADTDQLNRSIAVQPDSDPRIQAVLTTDHTDPPGGGGRKIPFRRLGLSRMVARPSARDRATGVEPPFRVSGSVTDSSTGKAIGDFLVTPRYAFLNTTPPVFGEWEDYDGERFQGGSFDLSYDHRLLIGSLETPEWQFLIEADGYEPFVTRIVGNEEGGVKLNCRLKPAEAHRRF